MGVPRVGTIRAGMGRQVDFNDILDTTEVAEVLRLSPETGRNTVRQYRRRYGDFPEPVLIKGGGRCLLWLRSEIVAWRDRRPAR